MGNSTVVPCGATKSVTFTQGSCSIVFKCPDDVQSTTPKRAVGYAAGLKGVCRMFQPENDPPRHLISGASAVKYWGRVCYMKAGK
jgi:hypothetical protein